MDLFIIWTTFITPTHTYKLMYLTGSQLQYLSELCGKNTLYFQLFFWENCFLPSLKYLFLLVLQLLIQFLKLYITLSKNFNPLLKNLSKFNFRIWLSPDSSFSKRSIKIKVFSERIFRKPCLPLEGQSLWCSPGELLHPSSQRSEMTNKFTNT